MHKVPITIEGSNKLMEELEQLKKTDRPTVIAAIAEARAHGDLKENAEYHAAREQQSFIEGRIKELESKLSHAHVIDISKIKNTGKVLFGVTVTLINLSTTEEVKYHIVGEDESDIKENKLSVISPIARAIIGKMEGDEVSIAIPSGEVEYEIIQVEHILF